jgi:hypothetical protein
MMFAEKTVRSFFKGTHRFHIPGVFLRDGALRFCATHFINRLSFNSEYLTGAALHGRFPVSPHLCFSSVFC